MPGKSAVEFRPFKSDQARERYLAHYDEVATSWPIDSGVRNVETDCGTTFMRVSGPAGAPPPAAPQTRFQGVSMNRPPSTQGVATATTLFADRSALREIEVASCRA